MTRRYTKDLAAKSDFDNMLAEAEEIEQIVLRWLQQCQPAAKWLKAEGNHPQFDMMNCMFDKVEVKYDKKFINTGNLYIEENLLKESTCDYLIVVTHQDKGVTYAHIIWFDKLKTLCRVLWGEGKRFIRGGEFGLMDGMLVSQDRLSGRPWHAYIVLEANIKPLSDIICIC